MLDKSPSNRTFKILRRDRRLPPLLRLGQVRRSAMVEHIPRPCATDSIGSDHHALALRPFCVNARLPMTEDMLPREQHRHEPPDCQPARERKAY